MEDRDDKGRFTQGNKQGKGRPKGALSINDELRKLLRQKDDKGRPYIEIFAKQIFAEALKGNEKLIIELWQQIDGKAKQSVDIGGQQDNAIKVELVYIDPKDTIKE